MKKLTSIEEVDNGYVISIKLFNIALNEVTTKAIFIAENKEVLQQILDKELFND